MSPYPPTQGGLLRVPEGAEDPVQCKLKDRLNARSARALQNVAALRASSEHAAPILPAQALCVVSGCMSDTQWASCHSPPKGATNRPSVRRVTRGVRVLQSWKSGSVEDGMVGAQEVT